MSNTRRIRNLIASLGLLSVVVTPAWSLSSGATPAFAEERGALTVTLDIGGEVGDEPLSARPHIKTDGAGG